MSASSQAAPIALFTYNRPQHARRALESITRNPDFARSPLTIYCDGPKRPEHVESVEANRRAVRESAPPHAHIVARDENAGLANSIVSGVTEHVEEFGRVIVVEDDLVFSRGALPFLNEALERYAHEDGVMHISAYMFPVDRELPEAFFYREATCWGWATWDRAWQHFEPDAHKLIAEIDRRELRSEFNVRDSMYFYPMLRKQAAGEVDSWAIRWYASMFLKGGLSLHPRRSYVENLGFDGSGVHCNVDERFIVSTTDQPIRAWPSEIVESAAAVDAMIEYRLRSNSKPAAAQTGRTKFPPNENLYKWKRALGGYLRQAFGVGHGSGVLTNARRLWPRGQMTRNTMSQGHSNPPEPSPVKAEPPSLEVQLSQFLESSKLEPVLMDIGSAGASPSQWQPLASNATIVGFEPDGRNPDSNFGKSFKRNVMLSKVVVPDDDNDEADFILTDYPSCSSLLEPDLEALGSFSFRDLFKVTRHATMPATSLNRIVTEHGLGGVHWLKVDAQGADLSLIKSLSRQNLATLLAVDIEPGFIHAYKEEALFPECHTWFDENGFWLADLKYQAYAKVRPETIERYENQGWSKETLLAKLKKSPTAAEAFYMRRVDWFEREAKDRDLWILGFTIALASGHTGHALDLQCAYQTAVGADNEYDKMATLTKTVLEQG